MKRLASGESRRRIDGTMRAAGDLLNSMTHASGPAMESLARTFAKLAEESSRVVGLAARIVECLGDDGITSVLPALRALGVAEMGLIESRLQATRGILDSTTVERTVLGQLSKVTGSQSGIALKTRILAMMTNIEVGRLGSRGKTFECLASELSNFSKRLSADTEELELHTGSRQTAVEATNQVLVTQLPRLAAELVHIQGKLSCNLALLESDLARLDSIPIEFGECVRKLGTQLAGAIAAIQSYDITRQQIEHVQSALGEIASEAASGSSGRRGSRMHSRPSLGITIQVFQLRQIRETVITWIGQVRDCMEAMLKIGASEMAGISPMVRAREQDVSDRLDHIALMKSESRAHGARIRGTVGEHLSLVKLIEKQVKTAAATQQTLHLLTLNAIIEGDRLGAQAATILEIGNGIADITQEWRGITDQSSQAMQAITELVDGIDRLTANFSEVEDPGLQRAHTQARTGLDSLRTASEFAANQSREIELGLEAMRSMAKGIGHNVDVLAGAHRQIDEVLSALESVQAELGLESHKALDEREAEELKQRYSASYTTEQERDVLCAALGGSTLPSLKLVLEGNGVELF